MNESSAGEDLDILAESFLARLRKGERPAIAEYAARQPELASRILELFPALVAMEGLKPSGTGEFPMAPRLGLIERLGDYRIVRLIGTGGMGIVYEAERESLQARVALKLLRAHTGEDAGFRRRFRNEAKSAARLHHTNIVSVFDFGEHEGVLYYAMQYIPGAGLNDVLDDVRRLRGPDPAPSASRKSTIAMGLLTGNYPADAGETPATLLEAVETILVAPRPDPEPEATSPELSRISSLGGSGRVCYHREVARIGAEVAEALAYAHSRGVLHRDIKPSNLLLDARGNAWVTDFGLAKSDGSENLTDTGEFVGTLRFMAPERFEGHSDARCDIYALGVTLYEMLALRPAFEDSNRARLVRRILQDTPTPLRKHDPRISLDLSTVVHKAMAHVPADRFRSADELADELRRIVKNQPIRSRRIPLHEQYWRWGKRNPVLAGLYALAAALTIAITVISTTAALVVGRLNTEVNNQLTLVKRTEQRQRVLLWESNLQRARAARQTRQSGQRFDSLAAIAEAVKLGRELGHSSEKFHALRNEAIAALALPDLAQQKEFGHLTDDVTGVDVDDDFERYLACDRQGRCRVARIADDAELFRLPQSELPRHVRFGPGRLLLEVDSAGWKVWDFSGPRPFVRIDERRPATTYEFRPDGRVLVLIYADDGVATVDLSTGARRAFPPLKDAPPQERRYVGLHPTSDCIAVSSYLSAEVLISHLESGETVRVEPPWRPLGSHQCIWTPDGRTLLIPGPDRNSLACYDFSAAPLSARFLRTIESAPGAEVCIDPTGELLFGRDWGHQISLLDASSGRHLFRTRHFADWLAPRLRVDREGRRVFPGPWVAANRRFTYASVAAGREYGLLMPPTLAHGGGHISFSPDGRLLVVSNGHWITFYDVRFGRSCGAIRVPGTHGGTSSRFDSNGHLVTSSLHLGSFRWPIRPGPGNPGHLVVGPPERLPLHGGTDVSMSRDGTVIGQAMYAGYGTARHAGGWILRLDRREPPKHVAAGISMGGGVMLRNGVSVSPDGHWIAFFGDRNFVFDGRTGLSVWNPPQGIGAVSFSPDNRWLVTGDDGGRLYEVGTWKPGPRIGLGMIHGFTADATTALLSMNEGRLRLVEVATGRELAQFEGMEPCANSLVNAISPDGTKLAESRAEGVRLWDLRKIRTELARLGLDWDAPAYPPDGENGTPLSVTVVGNDFLDPDSWMGRAQKVFGPWLRGRRGTTFDDFVRADELARLGWHGLALWQYDSLVRREPKLLEARMRRGLELFCRGSWEAAARDFTEVLAGDPFYEHRGPARSRLAWSYHELGRHEEAAAELTKLLESNPNGWRAVERASVLLIRAEFSERAGKPDRAAADRMLAASMISDLSKAANSRAWSWLVPDAELEPQTNWRFVGAARLLARKAVEISPSDATCRNTLGIALLASGQFAEARTALETTLSLGKEGLGAWVFFPLAICEYRLGNLVAAREAYGEAVAWAKSHEGRLGGDPDELAALQAEARQVLGVKAE